MLSIRTVRTFEFRLVSKTGEELRKDENVSIINIQLIKIRDNQYVLFVN